MARSGILASHIANRAIIELEFEGNGTVLHERYKGRFPEPEG